MTSSRISAEDPNARRRVAVLDTDMAYLDVGTGDPIVFLHGNPTSSYLWRNIIPHLEGLGRCLAPDLVGMGESGKAPRHSYRFVDHARYLDSWFEGSILTGAQRAFCRSFPQQEEITVKGFHFIQEDSPTEIGMALADFVKRTSA